MTASLNPYISRFGEEFDAGKSSQYRMAIQCSLGGLSFALLDTTNQTIIALECFQSDILADSNDLFRTLERALEGKGLNNKSFLSVSCLIENRHCVLVPDALFDEADLSKYLDFTTQIPESHTIVSEHLESAQCHNVYALMKTWQHKVLNKWENTSIRHSSSVLINSMMQDKDNNGIFINVRNRNFDILIKKEGKLLFFNNFKFNTKEDFAYFMLFSMEQYGFSGQETPVCFSGLIRPASDVIGLCGRYLRNIRFVEDTHTLQVSKALDEVPFQYYFIHYQSFLDQHRG